jgi:AraC-like DNA-binding protein
MRRAKRLLAYTDRALVDIALDVGFACQSHYTTLFHKHTGTTPGAYRTSAKMHEASARSSVSVRSSHSSRPAAGALQLSA